MPVSGRRGPKPEERATKASRKLRRATVSNVSKRSVGGSSPYELGKDLFGADERPGSDFSSTFKAHLQNRLREPVRQRS